VPSQTLSIDDFVDLCEQLPIIDGHRKGVFTHTAYGQAFSASALPPGSVRKKW